MSPILPSRELYARMLNCLDADPYSKLFQLGMPLENLRMFIQWEIWCSLLLNSSDNDDNDTDDGDYNDDSDYNSGDTTRAPASSLSLASRFSSALPSPLPGVHHHHHYHRHHHHHHHIIHNLQVQLLALPFHLRQSPLRLSQICTCLHFKFWDKTEMILSIKQSCACLEISIYFCFDRS